MNIYIYEYMYILFIYTKARASLLSRETTNNITQTGYSQ